MSSLASDATDVEIVTHLQANPRDQRAWSPLIRRVETPIRRSLWRLLGTQTRFEDIEDALQYALIEFQRRIVGDANIDPVDPALFADGGVVLEAYASRVSAWRGVRALRGDQYGADYETIILPALKLRGLVTEGLPPEEACAKLGISSERAGELADYLAAHPDSFDPTLLPEVSTSSVASAEEEFDSTAGAMLAAVETVIEEPHLRRFVVALAGTRETGPEASPRSVCEALGIDAKEASRLRIAVVRGVGRKTGLDPKSSEARARVAALLRGEEDAA